MITFKQRKISDFCWEWIPSHFLLREINTFPNLSKYPASLVYKIHMLSIRVYLFSSIGSSFWNGLSNMTSWIRFRPNLFRSCIPPFVKFRAPSVYARIPMSQVGVHVFTENRSCNSFLLRGFGDFWVEKGNITRALHRIYEYVYCTLHERAKR